MRGCFLTVLAILMVIGCPELSRGSGDEPVKSTISLSADEIEIYRGLLDQYASKQSGYLNISSRTYPLDAKSNRNGLTPDCLRGIELENLASLARSFHDLPLEVVDGKRMRLVDPKKQAKIVRDNDPDNTMRRGLSASNAVRRAYSTALFSLSEIAFDKEHRHAIVAYSFWCGSLCGQGSTLIFEKVGGKWKRVDHWCGGWIS
jgi:hypothetical protein